jgi:threonyl-tRNA synthetase
VDDSRETVSKKVRAAQVMRIPYTLVMGDREIEAGTVAVRDRDGNEVRGVAFDDFVAKAIEEAATRSLHGSTFEPAL